MRKLIQGIVEFRKNLTEETRALFAHLALGQKPDALFITCSDSRVAPDLIASTNPGDLFVLRNVGNLIPPIALDSSEDDSASAALEFSIFSLKVSNIIVCGHSDCGAMQTLIQGIDTSPCCSHLRCWLKHGEESLRRLQGGFTTDASLAQHNQLSQVNVLQQVEHIKSYPFVKKLVEKKRLGVHGWWFDIEHADVYCYEDAFKRFTLIDEDEASAILHRIQ